jgi:Sodium/hydrogen exchanger family
MPHHIGLILTLTGGFTGTCARICHAQAQIVTHRWLSAGRRSGRPVHARLCRRQRNRHAIRRDRRDPPDVWRGSALSFERPARRAQNRDPRRHFQIAIASALGAIVTRMFGWSWAAGIVYGMAISVASTVVLTRVLADNGDLHTPSGHIAIGWLIVEDLFTILVLVLLPALFGATGNTGGGVWLTLCWALLKLTALASPWRRLSW